LPLFEVIVPKSPKNGLVIEEAQQGVARCEPCPVRSRRIEEPEGAILVHRRRGRRECQLDLIVHPGPLDAHPALERVVSTNVRDVVGPLEDEVVPGARVRIVVDRGEALQSDVGQLFRIELRAGKQLTIVDPQLRGLRTAWTWTVSLS